MGLKALGKVLNAGKQFFRNGAAARTAKNFKPTINFKGANGMRAAMFGTIGAAALGGTLASCSQQEDYYNDLTGKHEVTMNLEKRSIPTRRDTIYQDRVVRDTTYLPGEVVRDTVFIDRPGETVRDTVYLPGEVVRDTVFQDRIVHDTITVKLPGEIIEVPTNPEYKGEPEPVLDRITNILTPGEDTDGTTVLMKGMKMFEQHAIEGRFDGPNTSEKQQVYGLHVVDMEDDHNPTTYVKQMKIGKTTFNGKDAVTCDIIPPYQGREKQKYLDMNAGDWNIFGAKRIVLVPDEANNCVRKFVQGSDGKYTQEGYIYRDEHGHVKEKNGLEGGQFWEQKIENLQFINSKRFLNELHPNSYGK